MSIDSLLNKVTYHAELAKVSLRPKRARAIIFDPKGQYFIGMARTKPNRSPYISFPGGHVEPSDQNPLATIVRELEEELTNIHTDDVVYQDKIIRYEDEFFYIGVIKDFEIELVLGGPEKDGDPEVYGTYDPKWFLIEDMPDINVLPKEISSIIYEAYKTETS
jgi:8-oxo-dGTP pyrophosphatase MutT (NUDIX family)